MDRFRAAAPGDMLMSPLETLVAVYHRPSGQTHLLAQPLPEVLAASGSQSLAMADLLDRLGIAHAPAAMASLRARLDELEALGLVERVP